MLTDNPPSFLPNSYCRLCITIATVSDICDLVPQPDSSG